MAMHPRSSADPDLVTPMPKGTDPTPKGTDRPELRLEVTTDQANPRVTTIRVFGEIDVTTVSPLESALELAVDPGCETVVDLSGVTFIDSTGVAALVRASNDLFHQQGRLRLTGGRPQVRQVITALGLEEQLGLEGEPVAPDRSG
jgi:anti-anti-sigma factor